MTGVERGAGASHAHAHAIASSAHETAAHRSARVNPRARSWRSSVFRHSLHAWHPTHCAPHAYAGAVEQLLHRLGGHAPAHPLARHDGHGERQHRNPNGNPRHPQSAPQKNQSPRHSKSDSQQQHKHQQQQQQQQSRQQQRHPKPAAQAPRHLPRAPHPLQANHATHRMHGTWSTRRESPADAHPDAQACAANGVAADGDGSNPNGRQRDTTRDDARNRAAISRVAAVARAELQALAASIAERPLVYAQGMREAVIRQRCAGHDPLAVAIDVLKARQLANDDSRSSYDDLKSFLADFKRVSEGSGARGALTPLLAFHDLRVSTASLRLRSLNQLATIGLARVSASLESPERGTRFAVSAAASQR